MAITRNNSPPVALECMGRGQKRKAINIISSRVVCGNLFRFGDDRSHQNAVFSWPGVASGEQAFGISKIHCNCTIR